MDWWSPLPISGYYWPADIPRNTDLATFVALYAYEGGFLPCDSGAPEPESEKIALYADSNGSVTHAARLTATDAWTSKLGVMEDIEHATLAGLEQTDYGHVVQFLKKSVLNG